MADIPEDLDVASYYAGHVAAALNAGYSYDEIQAHHEANGMGTPPQPPIERAWNPNPITPEEDWLQSFGPQPLAPSIPSENAPGESSPPSAWTADQFGDNPWNRAGERADQVAPKLDIPDVQDIGAITDQVPPWEVNRSTINQNPADVNQDNGLIPIQDMPAEDI